MAAETKGKKAFLSMMIGGFDVVGGEQYAQDLADAEDRFLEANRPAQDIDGEAYYALVWSHIAIAGRYIASLGAFGLMDDDDFRRWLDRCVSELTDIARRARCLLEAQK